MEDGDRRHGHAGRQTQDDLRGSDGQVPSASREVRIVTNLCVYWDEIFLSEDAARRPCG